MGSFQSCFARSSSNSGENSPEKIKQYSWDKTRQNVDTSMFTIQNLGTRMTEIRLPGSIKGEQFVIQNCEDATIYLFDHINTLTIDDCKNCKIFAGPVKGSLFIRDCSNCTIVAACGQFRTRDCNKIDIFLYCLTQPIIESSTHVRFACFQFWYPELRTQFEMAGLSPYDNLWWNVHDFTPGDETKNWSLLGECYKVEDFLPMPDVTTIEISTDQVKSVVPLTAGSRRRDYQTKDFCLVVVTDEEELESSAAEILDAISVTHLEMIRSRKIYLEASDVNRIFFDARKRFPKKFTERGGTILAFQFAGPNCITQVKETLHSAGQAGIVVASDTTDVAIKDIKNLFNFIGSQMGI